MTALNQSPLPPGEGQGEGSNLPASTVLTQNLPLLAGAPNGTKKLRELILELAVRGKLVPQDPSDEPASELLKRIAEEKTRLVAEGKIKKPKSLPDVETLEKLYHLPAGWEWTTLPGTASYQIGKTPPTKEAKYWDDSGLPWVSISDMEHYGEITQTSRRVSEVASKDIFKYQPVPAGTLLMSFKLTVGKVAILGIDAYHNEAIISLSPYNGVSKEYLFRFLPSIALGGQQKNALMGNTLNSESMAQLLIPIPPLAEQQRIVSKVDELMALCDRLEAQQVDAESAHAQLVQALLDSLTQANDATDFAINWQRLAVHFHTLFTTEPSIDALKQTLLQLAVMGKLVPQDPSDEPAVRFLQRNGINSQPYTLHGWAEVPLGHLGEILGGSTPSKSNAEFWDGDIPWVSPKDMKRPVIQDSQDHITAKALEQTSLKVVPSQSLLMVVRGMILAHSFPVALTAREVTINQDMKALVPPKEISTYLLMYLQAAKGVMVGLVDRSSHGTCKLISEKLWSHAIYLPPLFEQHRIVAKVDQLMALCDQLKTRLTQARQLNEQLASTLVEQAVA